MLAGKRIAVMMPAYNVCATVERTHSELPMSIVDDVILVDDGSSDGTGEVARKLGIHVVRHPQNRGYGGVQKTGYRVALERGADVVVMVHADYQYSPKLVTAMASLVALGRYDCVLGSRMLAQDPKQGGMPLYKYVANRFLTGFENAVLGVRLSEYHTGYRAFSRHLLETLALEENSNDFVFDNQMLAQTVHAGFRVGEVSCPTRYESDSSSMSFRKGITYGLGVLRTTLELAAHRSGLRPSARYSIEGRKLAPEPSSVRDLRAVR
jgi:glycosyltransferase involved in cell wall biosynthesis